MIYIKLVLATSWLTYIEVNVKIAERFWSIFDGEALIGHPQGVSGGNDVVSTIGDTNLTSIQVSEDDFESSESLDQLET